MSSKDKKVDIKPKGPAPFKVPPVVVPPAEVTPKPKGQAPVTTKP
ncbi:hypothetical protein [Pseudomonas agarici]|nr:hypothetical protein [Pseudomonas agarici]